MAFLIILRLNDKLETRSYLVWFSSFTCCGLSGIYDNSAFLCVQVEEANIHIQDPELRKVLSLTTADLRFADYLVKHVTENRDDVFLDGTGWEGGDEWIRAQFALYLHSLLSSALQPGGRDFIVGRPPF